VARLLWGRFGVAVPISRRKARRTNSETLIFSRRAWPARIFWTCRGSRNVTGTLPFGSFVLGMNHVYDCIIHLVNTEFLLPCHIHYDTVAA